VKTDASSIGTWLKIDHIPLIEAENADYLDSAACIPENHMQKYNVEILVSGVQLPTYASSLKLLKVFVLTWFDFSIFEARVSKCFRLLCTWR